MQPIIPYFQTIRFTVPLPDFFPMESLIIHGFGLCVGIGIVYGSQLAFSRGRRIGLDESTMKAIFIAMVIGVIVGGHVGYGLFYFPEQYFANPKLFLDPRAGLSSVAGFISCAVLFSYILWRRKKPFLPYADTIVYGFSFGWIWGRIGCTLNHEHPGTATNFILGRYCRPVEGWTWDLPQWMVVHDLPDLRFSHCVDDGPRVTDYTDTVSVDYSGVVAVHDMGMYEVFYALVLFSLILFLDKKPRMQGLYLLILIYTYAPLRFAMDFLRVDFHNARYVGLTPAQWGCVGFLVVCTVAVVRYREHFQVIASVTDGSESIDNNKKKKTKKKKK